jgi:hypothetical protein
MQSVNNYSINSDTLTNINLLNFVKELENNIDLKILNLKKDKFNLIEKFVYDSACFHLKQLNESENNSDFDITNYNIEFWTKNNISKKNGINVFHIDCDENKKKQNKIVNPLLSCVTYLNDSEFPILLTDINHTEYLFKEFENKNSIQIIFPRENNQITFDGSKYHGVCDVFDTLDNIKNNSFERNIIAINLWKEPPTNISFYEPISLNADDYNKEDIVFFFEKGQYNNTELYIKSEQFTFDFYENMLYNSSDFRFPKEISELVKIEYNQNKFNFIITDIDNTTIKTDYKNNSLLKDIKLINELNSNEIKNNDIINSAIYNRFIQRNIYSKMFSKNVCEWIIFESENYAKNNGGWTTRRHVKYPTTDLPVKNIQPIFNFVLLSYNEIFSKIKKSYSLSETIEFNISDFFIVKYNSEMQNELELHNDGSFLSINILLSNSSDFEGGGTFFNDNTVTNLEQGDVLVHSGQVKHSGVKITKGTRYILVAFVSLIVNLKSDFL